MASLHRTRRVIAILVILLFMAIPVAGSDIPSPAVAPQKHTAATRQVLSELDHLAVKGRAPKTGYAREQFGNGWGTTLGCSTREIILHRDLHDVRLNDDCKVLSGVLDDPYTGRTIQFIRGPSTSNAVQIDHVVALSNAWQTGAQQLSSARRVQLANDPLNLLAVDGPANEEKSDGDAATWLPSNKSFRCQYVSRQVAVKSTYKLWVTSAEQAALIAILSSCQ